jgi:ribosome-associated protein
VSGLTRIAKAEAIAGAAIDLKAQDIVVLDVRNVLSFADTLILATGTSDRHTRAIADAIEARMLSLGERPLGSEGYDEGRWVLIDLTDVIVHVFLREVREFYDLERLWSEAPVLILAGVDAQTATR